MKPHIFKGGGLWYCCQGINIVGKNYGVGQTPYDAYMDYMTGILFGDRI